MQSTTFIYIRQRIKKGIFEIFNKPASDMNPTTKLLNKQIEVVFSIESIMVVTILYLKNVNRLV